MWDVIWTDPDKELVGEHRARKGQLKHEREKSSIRSGRDSATTSSSNSSSETPFRFFWARSAKNTATLKGKETNRSPSFSGLATPSLTSTLSPFSQTFDSESRRSSGMVTTAPVSPNKVGPEALFSSSERDTIDSIAANLTSSGQNGSGSESANIATLIQMLGDLPARIEGQESAKLDLNSPETVRRGKETDITMPSIDTRLVTPPKSPSRRYADYPNCCLKHYANELQRPEKYRHSASLPESSVMLTPPPKSPRRPTPVPLEINNPSAWRTTSQWEDRDLRQRRKAAKKASKKITKDNVINTEAFAVHNPMMGIRSAAWAPTAMILAKVKQVMAFKPNEGQEVGLENSKQHWMLSLLHGLGYIADPDHDEDRHNISLPATKAYATYIAAVHPDSQVYHLTKESSRASWSRNVQTVQAPPAEATCFPMAPRLVQTVYSFSLPSSCPHNVLPILLSSVYKCLKPRGSLKLTIIDPLPYADTLGHKLRFWMEQHLFPNLERKSLCLEPSRLFPKLLGDAGLRGRGSRRTTVKFFALQENARGLDRNRDPDPSIEQLSQEQHDKAELRSLVGRMFWVEVWGQHVTPVNTWWWDDPECVAECRELGTFWEYHIIDSVKG
ncbi:hypothetical protein IF1G_01394 [Cordyceps javanica]|uniref:Uncharacterized protein n=1 Tax=Cordyceps javanica TaxID=43265 RepID=A0A545VC52_9HYPO|nr:hypothetical protein IF1G_01394 [Cordyceps javanica]